MYTNIPLWKFCHCSFYNWNQDICKFLYFVFVGPLCLLAFSLRHIIHNTGHLQSQSYVLQHFSWYFCKAKHQKHAIIDMLSNIGKWKCINVCRFSRSIKPFCCFLKYKVKHKKMKLRDLLFFLSRSYQFSAFLQLFL